MTNWKFLLSYIVMFPAHWLDKKRAKRYSAERQAEYTPERPYFSPSVADRLALAHAREEAEHRQALAGTWVESPDKGGVA